MAKLHECRLEFIKLRAKEVPYSVISEKLGVSKTTLVKWNKLLCNEIGNQREIVVESLLHQYQFTRLLRLEQLLKLFNKIDCAIEKCDFSKIPLDKLFNMRMTCMKEIKKEKPRCIVTDLNLDIPDNIGFLDSSTDEEPEIDNLLSPLKPENSTSDDIQGEVSGNETKGAIEKGKSGIDADENEMPSSSNKKETVKSYKDNSSDIEKKDKAIRDLMQYENKAIYSPSFLLDDVLKPENVTKMMCDIMLGKTDNNTSTSLSNIFEKMKNQLQQKSMSKGLKSLSDDSEVPLEKTQSAFTFPENHGFKSNLSKEKYEILGRVDPVGATSYLIFRINQNPILFSISLQFALYCCFII